MSLLLDQLLTEEQRASCAIHDVPKEWPAEAAHACTELGHKDFETVEDCPWTLVAIVVGFVGAIVLSMAAPMGFAP